MAEKNRILYVGTKNPADQAGIRTYFLNEPEAGPISSIEGVEAPAFLALREDEQVLFALSSENGGKVLSFGRTSDGWEKLSDAPTVGKGPSHIYYDEANGFLLTANYGGGSISLFAVKPDGTIDAVSDVKQHEGKGPNADRQEGPHAHFVGAADKGAYYCCDLGIDRVVYYKLDAEAKRLVPDPAKDLVLPPGSGPRHFVTDPENAAVYYVLCELSSEIAVFDTSLDQPLVQVISMLPTDWSGETKAAAVKFSPDGRYLYGTNRGYDSIAVYKVVRGGSGDAGSSSGDGSAASGSEPLELVEIFEHGAEFPWDMEVTEDLVITANQISGTVSYISRDVETGKLSNPEEKITIPEARCVLVR